MKKIELTQWDGFSVDLDELPAFNDRMNKIVEPLIKRQEEGESEG